MMRKSCSCRIFHLDKMLVRSKDFVTAWWIPSRRWRFQDPEYDMRLRPLVNSYVRKLSSFIVLGILLLESLGLAAQTPRQDSQSKPGTIPGDINNIQHIVFIIKENRTFDQYFGTYPGANGATTAVISTGQTIHLVHSPDPLPRDVSHGWFDSVQGVNGGKMDLFDIISGSNLNGDMLGLSQLTQSDLPNYFNYAQHF